MDHVTKKPGKLVKLKKAACGEDSSLQNMAESWQRNNWSYPWQLFEWQCVTKSMNFSTIWKKDSTLKSSLSQTGTYKHASLKCLHTLYRPFRLVTEMHFFLMTKKALPVNLVYFTVMEMILVSSLISRVLLFRLLYGLFDKIGILDKYFRTQQRWRSPGKSKSVQKFSFANFHKW